MLEKSALLEMIGTRGSAASVEDLFGEGDLGMDLDAALADAGGVAVAGGGASLAEAQATLRSWFPETFIFEPLLITDEQGRAALDVTVPDQLTTWRVLGLAHDRAGRQAGALASFASTLPLYLDAPAPPDLRVGDQLRLPLQVVNNRDQGWSGRIEARVEGAAARGVLAGGLSLEGRASALRYLPVEALRPGLASIEAQLGSADAVKRPLRVAPLGRPLRRVHSGALAGSQELSLSAPEGALPGASGLELVVYPGPLSLLQAELGRAASLPARLSDQLYAYALSGAGQQLAQRLGVEADEVALRRLRLQAWQALVRRTRAPSVSEALLVLSGLQSVQDPMAAALRERLSAQLAQAQSPDGSFAGSWGGRQTSLERGLVFSAEAARLAGESQPLLLRRAEGFVARHVDEVRDPYTAAVLLAAGLPDPERREPLRQLLRSAAVRQENGGAWIEPGSRSRRWDGSAPRTLETTACAVAALAQDPQSEALVQELGSALLGSYRPRSGFGDGVTGLAALRALSTLVPESLPESVQVRLWLEEQLILDEQLRLAAGHVPIVAQAALRHQPGSQSCRLQVEPAVPGLAYALTEEHWVPPEPQGSEDAFSLLLEQPDAVRVGEKAELALSAAVPGGAAFRILLELPAGLEAERAGLERLVSQDTLLGYELERGQLTLRAPAQRAGASFRVQLQAVPTLAGRFHWGQAVLSLERDEQLRTEAAPGALRVGLGS